MSYCMVKIKNRWFKRMTFSTVVKSFWVTPKTAMFIILQSRLWPWNHLQEAAYDPWTHLQKAAYDVHILNTCRKPRMTCTFKKIFFLASHEWWKLMTMDLLFNVQKMGTGFGSVPKPDPNLEDYSGSDQPKKFRIHSTFLDVFSSSNIYQGVRCLRNRGSREDQPCSSQSPQSPTDKQIG